MVDTNFNVRLGKTWPPAYVENGFVTSLVVQDDGKILVGGSFKFVNGTNRAGIVRLSQAGIVDGTFDPGTGIGQTSGYVNALALQQDGKILVGGSFQTVNGSPGTNLARLHPNGYLDSGFAAGWQASGDVDCLAQAAGGKVYVGGGAYGSNQSPVVRLKADGTVDPTFAPAVIAGENQAYVNALAVQRDGKLVVAGDLSLLYNAPRQILARLIGGSEAASVLDLNLFPVLTVSGAVGTQYRIEYATDLIATNWAFLTNITLPTSPYLFIDTTSPRPQERFYRVSTLP